MCAQSLNFSIQPMGDQAFLVRLFTRSNPELATDKSLDHTLLLAARYLSRFLEQLDSIPPSLTQSEFVAGYSSVLIPYNSQAKFVEEWITYQVAEFIRLYTQDSSAKFLSSQLVPREHHIPVIYGGEYGLDLEAVAQLNGLTPSDVISLHSGQSYEVYFVGFAPGFAYLGPLPSGLDAPRLGRPRSKVKAGTVALASGMTAIYPLTSPGGWQLIGYTPTPVFTPQAEPPLILLPADKVIFQAV
jgi:KipI family sensor histidine kinase inhibitor